MPAPSWAVSGIDREWLLGKAPAFGRIHVRCKAGQHSPEKASYLHTVYTEYEKKFPGRSAKWSFKGIGLGGTEAERRKAIIEKIANFLKHALKKELVGSDGKKEKLLDLTKTKGSRAEAAINAYKRFGGEALAAEIEADWKAYVKSCAADGKPVGMPQAGRRNQFLKAKFEAEPEDIKNQVRATCKDAYWDSPGTILHTLLNVDGCEVDEEERQRCAEQLQVNLGRLFRTLKIAADNIEAETGWSVAILVGGPKPVNGGNIHVECVHSRRDENETFDEMFPEEWRNIARVFGTFCEKITPEEKHMRFTLENLPGGVKAKSPPPPPTSSSAGSESLTPVTSLDASPGPGPEEMEIEKSQPASAAISASSGSSVSATSTAVSEAEQSSPKPVDSSLPATSSPRQDDSIDTQAPAHSPPSLSSHEEGVTSISTAGTAISAGTAVSEAEQRTPSPKLVNSSLPATSSPRQDDSIDTHQDPSHSPPNLSSQEQDAIKQIQSQSAPIMSGEPSSPSRPPPSRVTRSLTKDTQKEQATMEAEIKKFYYWPSVYFKEKLGEIGGNEIGDIFRDFELAYDGEAESRSKIIAVAAAPIALKKWRAFNVGQCWKVPTKHLDSTHLENTFTWYCRLQPTNRGSTWPLARGPDPETWNWNAIKKNGSSGIFLVLMAVSWTPKTNPDEQDRIKSLLDDIKWVLRTLTDLVSNPPSVVQPKGRKRKVDGEDRVAKRARNGAKAA